MSKKSLLMVAAAVLSVAVMSSANGAVANDHRSDSAPVVREAHVAGIAIAPSFRIDETTVGHDFDARTGNAESHVVKAGLWSSVKSAASKVKSAAKTVGSKVATFGKTAAKGIGTQVKNIANKVGNASIKSVGKGIVKFVGDGVKTLPGVCTVVKKIKKTC